MLPSVRDIVDKYGIMADKKLGQNFLFDLNLTDRIARSAGSIANKPILEIGPGPGALTRSLLNAGANVTAIEMDRRCIHALEDYLVPASNGKLHIIKGDALDSRIYDGIKAGPYIIANLPYNISTALLTMWLDMLPKFSGFTLMFQKEVADRIMSGPCSKDYGRLSVKVQWLCEVRHEFDIPPSAFYPPPKVTSSVITITPRQEPLAKANAATLEKLCKAVFGQRRKTLRVSLKQLTPSTLDILEKAGIDSNRRPEELSIEEFCTLANALDSLP